MSSNEHVNVSDVLERELLEMWRDALQSDTLTIDDDFFECGGDSLLAIKLLFEVEQLIGKLLPESIIFETGTVRQLLEKVTATGNVLPQGSVLVGSEQGKMVHFFHGDFTHGGVWVKTFSKLLGSDFCIHAIPPHLPHEGALPNSIEDMAKERLPKILETQPNGPYILLGHCNGALVGFEAARILVSMGKEVKAVVMVDPLIMSVRRSAQLIFLVAAFFMRLLGIQKNKQHKHLVWIWKKLKAMDKRTKNFWPRILFYFHKAEPRKRPPYKKLLKDSYEWKERKDIRQHYYNALFDYKPCSLNVPMLYITLRFSGHAWRRITKDTVFINICRGHHTPWSETYAPYLVDKIREFINR